MEGRERVGNVTFVSVAGNDTVLWIVNLLLSCSGGRVGDEDARRQATETSV